MRDRTNTYPANEERLVPRYSAPDVIPNPDEVHTRVLSEGDEDAFSSLKLNHDLKCQAKFGDVLTSSRSAKSDTMTDLLPATILRLR